MKSNSNRTAAKDYSKKKLEDPKYCICSASAFIFRRLLKIQPETLRENRQRRITQKIDIQQVEHWLESTDEENDSLGPRAR